MNSPQCESEPGFTKPLTDKCARHQSQKATLTHRDGGVEHAHGEPGAAEDAVALSPRPRERVGPVGAGEARQHGLHRHAALERPRLEVDERAPVGRRPLREHQQLAVAVPRVGGLKHKGGRNDFRKRTLLLTDPACISRMMQCLSKGFEVRRMASQKVP